MHSQTVTLFNRLPGTGNTADTWYPTVLYGCNLITDRSALASKYGTDSANNAVLNVPYKPVLGRPVIEGKLYRTPKEWRRNSAHAAGLTFTDGQLFDFFMIGNHAAAGSPISEAEYPAGFFQHMLDTYDSVYAITGSTQLSLIPHFEVTGK